MASSDESVLVATTSWSSRVERATLSIWRASMGRPSSGLSTFRGRRLEPARACSMATVRTGASTLFGIEALQRLVQQGATLALVRGGGRERQPRVVDLEGHAAQRAVCAQGLEYGGV